MKNADLQAELGRLDRVRGDHDRDLRIGEDHVRIRGLDEPLAEALALRWGGFLVRSLSRSPSLTLQLFRSPSGWLLKTPGETYRMEALPSAATPVVVSYNYAICFDAGADVWRVAVNDNADEPVDRILDNVLRYFAARHAIAKDGFAMHGAAVLRDDRAHVFAGPSRSGKSTAVAMSAPGRSLGDDFALVLRTASGWGVPALPFDNSERIVEEPPAGLFPLAGIWRLHQDRIHRVVRPVEVLAVASLMGCAAFPWALPDLADPLLANVGRLVADGAFAHLYFSKDPGFWEKLS